MYVLNKRFAWIHAVVSVVVVFSSVLLPYHPVKAESVEITPGINNEASNLPQDTLGYYEFRDITKSFVHGGGDVCISSNSSRWEAVQVDDGIKVWANGQFVGDFLSRTQPVGPITILSNMLVTGASNEVRVVLYDVQGSYRGTSPLFIVFGGQSSDWYNGCLPLRVVGPPVEMRLPAGQEVTLVWRYNAELFGCNVSTDILVYQKHRLKSVPLGH